MFAPKFELLKIDERKLKSKREEYFTVGFGSVCIVLLGRQHRGGVVLEQGLPFVAIKERSIDRAVSGNDRRFVLIGNYIHLIQEIKLHPNLPAGMQQGVATISEPAQSYSKITGTTEVNNSSYAAACQFLKNRFSSSSVVLFVSRYLT